MIEGGPIRTWVLSLHADPFPPERRPPQLGAWNCSWRPSLESAKVDLVTRLTNFFGSGSDRTPGFCRDLIR